MKLGRAVNQVIGLMNYRIVRIPPEDKTPRGSVSTFDALTPIDHEERFPSRIPDQHLYRAGSFEPWSGLPDFQRYYEKIQKHTLVMGQSCYTLLMLARQALKLGGDLMECGVYRGGTAAMLAHLLKDEDRGGRHLHLFDTFQGMPKTLVDRDYHREGDFGDTSLEAVTALMPPGSPVVFHPGRIPETFAGLDDLRLGLTHCDVDIYQAVLDCTAYAYPRTLAGGFILYDDYGVLTCTGARQAVDEFYADKPEKPLVLSRGQALVIKLPEHAG
jgi:O-methyltransferase